MPGIIFIDATQKNCYGLGRIFGGYSTKRFVVTHLTIYDYATNILWIMVDFVLNFLVNISYSISNNK